MVMVWEPVAWMQLVWEILLNSDTLVMLWVIPTTW
jgi:hypothetical protein